MPFIYVYTQIIGRPPAEADPQRYFQVTAPSVYQMIVTLERAGFIHRPPGTARSVRVVVDPGQLPPLRPTAEQLVRLSGQRY